MVKSSVSPANTPAGRGTGATPIAAALRLHKRKAYEPALAAWRECVARQPDDVRAHHGEGLALLALGRLREAQVAFERAIALQPARAEFHADRGTVLAQLGEYESALRCFDHALVLQPQLARAWQQRGACLFEMGRAREARPDFERAVALEPQRAQARTMLGICLLQLGEFAEGWRHYEARWDHPGFQLRRRHPGPLWTGREPLAGKRILLHAEQGYGDTLQFIRYAALVKERGAHVLAEVPPPLRSLLARVDGIDELCEPGQPVHYNCHCPLLSLPLAFGTELATIPAPRRYVQPAADKLLQWRDRLPHATMRIGLAWSGSAAHAHDARRSIRLADLLPSLPAGPQYVSLQKEVQPTDRPILAERPDILHFGDALRDFGDTAALCDQLDLVVSVDTAVAHLAGALGRPVWLLLPVNSDFRWLREREDSPWYPSFRLLRGTRPGDWAPVLNRLAATLAAHCN